MWAIIWRLILAVTPAVAAKVMTILGFTIFSYYGITTFINTMLSSSNNAYGSITGVTHVLLNIAGFDQSISIIGSAILSRVGLMAMKRFRIA